MDLVDVPGLTNMTLRALCGVNRNLEGLLVEMYTGLSNEFFEIVEPGRQSSDS